MANGSRPGERLAVVENQVAANNKKLDALEASIMALHSKLDSLITGMNLNYVSRTEFEEWKKNKTLERVVLMLVTAVVSAASYWMVGKIFTR